MAMGIDHYQADVLCQSDSRLDGVSKKPHQSVILTTLTYSAFLVLTIDPVTTDSAL